MHFGGVFVFVLFGGVFVFVHFGGVFVFVHFGGVFAFVHFGGVFAAFIVLALVNGGAGALEAANHRPDAPRQWLEHLDDEVYVVGHDPCRQYLQCKPLLRIELRQTPQKQTYTLAERIEPYCCRLGTSALDDAKQRIALFYR